MVLSKRAKQSIGDIPRDPPRRKRQSTFGVRAAGEIIPIAGRFHARVTNFQLACPACGSVFRVYTWGPRERQQPDWQKRKKRRPDYRNWDPRTGRWRCGDCGVLFIIGVIAWRPNYYARIAPPDQVPTLMESARLRERYPNLATNSILGHDLPANVVLQEGPEDQEPAMESRLDPPPPGQGKGKNRENGENGNPDAHLDSET